MKTALLLVLLPIVLWAAPPSAEPDAWTIQGRVLSVLSDGVFVTCTAGETAGAKRPPAGEIVFVRGEFRFVENEAITLEATPLGTHAHPSTTAQQTVRAFVIRH